MLVTHTNLTAYCSIKLSLQLLLLLTKKMQCSVYQKSFFVLQQFRTGDSELIWIISFPVDHSMFSLRCQALRTYDLPTVEVNHSSISTPISLGDMRALHAKHSFFYPDVNVTFSQKASSVASCKNENKNYKAEDISKDLEIQKYSKEMDKTRVKEGSAKILFLCMKDQSILCHHL